MFRLVPALAVTVPLTGCVACQKVPDTGTAVARSSVSVSGPETAAVPVIDTLPLIGCVACQNVPITGTAVARSWTSVSGPDTGCVACQNVPLTGCVTALPSTGRRPLTRAGSLPSMLLRLLLPVV